jgi:hypothetical protein
VARGVDEHIDALETFHRSCHRSFGFSFICKVGANAEEVHSQFSNLAFHFTKRVLVATDCGDIRTALSKPQSSRFADTRGRSGYQHSLCCKRFVHSYFSCPGSGPSDLG